ncbi:MAG: beta-N-acetylhexosaminidase [Nitrospira sp.]|nr:beta-N-acetylhexosaminidase [Nitrospira sp.]
MTVSRDQIGQLFMIGFDGTTVSPDLASFITEYKPGGIILFARNLESAAQIVDLTNELQRCSPHVPLLISIDQEGGRVSRLPKEFTIFPPCEVLGYCHSSELAYAAAATTAKELKSVGINMNMSPVLDVNSNPLNPIIGDRAFGSDPRIVSELGLATAGGLQDNGVVACGKHFPGHGDTTSDSHKELPIVTADRARLEHIEFPPFRQAVANGVASLMSAHVVYRALDETRPATLSPAIIGRFLREELYFDGVVLTDDLEMHAIIDHYGIGDAAVQAIQAGCDMPLICKDRNGIVAAYYAVEKAATGGDLSAGRLAQSFARIHRLKERFLHSYRPVTISDAKLVVGCRSHKALLRSIHHTRERIAKTEI